MPLFINFINQNFCNSMIISNEIINNQINITIILILSIILILIKKKKISKKKLRENEFIEIFWTTIPSIIILTLVIPSIISIYILEETKKAEEITKITGNQWYWSYTIKNKKKFSSYIYPSNYRRNLSTDYSIIINSKKKKNLIFLSNDVIHSWSVPSLNLKIDCVPGRINSSFIKKTKLIKIKGQCSEICGSNHRFIPISILLISFCKK